MAARRTITKFNDLDQTAHASTHTIDGNDTVIGRTISIPYRSAWWQYGQGAIQAASTTSINTSNDIRFYPLWLGDQMAFDMVAIWLAGTAATAGTVMRVGLWAAGNAARWHFPTGAPFFDVTVPLDGTINTSKTTTITGMSPVPPGLYWYGGAIQPTPAQYPSLYALGSPLTAAPVPASSPAAATAFGAYNIDLSGYSGALPDLTNVDASLFGFGVYAPRLGFRMV